MRKNSDRFAKLIGLDGRDDPRWVLLISAGYQWLKLSQLERAEKIFNGACLLLQDEPDGWCGLAECSFAAGHDEQALESCERAIRARNISRKTMALVYNLRWQALRRLGRTKEMFVAMQLVCELDPYGMGQTLLEQMRESMESSVMNIGVGQNEPNVTGL